MSDISLPAMLETIVRRKWSLTEIDWTAPGAERITDEQRPKLAAFMADLVWIECVGARGFGALANKAPTPELAAIYRHFEQEEHQHARAELALMHRWGMLAPGEVPEPNINVRLAIEWLERWSDGTSLAALGTVIPMLETALDGALVKFLLDEVDDPVCHEVFRRINADEARHLAVGFHVMDLLGQHPLWRLAIQAIGAWLRPSLVIGTLAYFPLLSRMRDNLIAMGLDERRLYAAMKRFGTVGDRSANTRRLPMFQFIKRHARVMVDREHPYHRFVDPLVRVSAHFPRRLLRPLPAWAVALADRIES